MLVLSGERGFHAVSGPQGSDKHECAGPEPQHKEGRRPEREPAPGVGVPGTEHEPVDAVKGKLESTGEEQDASREYHVDF